MYMEGNQQEQQQQVNEPSTSSGHSQPFNAFVAYPNRDPNDDEDDNNDRRRRGPV